jgi:hypothetical protein
MRVVLANKPLVVAIYYQLLNSLSTFYLLVYFDCDVCLKYICIFNLCVCVISEESVKISKKKKKKPHHTWDENACFFMLESYQFHIFHLNFVILMAFAP